MSTTASTAEEPEYRYAAFISYRHAEPDRRWAKWLHRTLETYRVPKRLVRENGSPRRVGRCFRDEEELPASADLSQDIRAALLKSKYLIVVCSPRTPQSEWVNKEVELFRELGRHDRILALLVEGDPRDSFPRALREIRKTVVDAHGKTRKTVEEIEPLAADVRPIRRERKGHLGRMAKLRLLACLLGVTFDDLRQREQERRMRQVAGLGVVGLLLLCTMGGLTAYAFAQRAAARTNEQRANDNAGEANRERAESDRLLAEMYAREGYKALETADDAAAALWFAEAALRTDGPEAPSAKARFERYLRYGRSARLLVPPIKSVKSANFSPDGTRIVTVDAKGVARMWDVSTSQPVGEPMTHQGYLQAAQFSPDGTRILTYDNKLHLWDARTGKPDKVTIDSGNVGYPAWSPDGRWIATSNPDKVVRFWDVTTGKQRPVSLPHDQMLFNVEFSRDGKRVLSIEQADINNGTTARVWDMETGRLLSPPKHGDGPAAIFAACLSPEGTVLATLGREEVRCWNASTGEPLYKPLNFGSIFLNALGPIRMNFLDEETLVIKCATPILWNFPSGGGGPFFQRGEPEAVLLDQSRQDQLLILGKDGRVATEYWSGLAPTAARAWGNTGVASPDGRRVLTWCGDGSVRLRDVRLRPPAVRLRHEGTVHGVAFSQDGSQIITDCSGFKDANVRQIWDPVTGKPAAAPVRTKDPPPRILLSPDGRRLIVDKKKELVVTDVGTGQALWTIPIPRTSLASPPFSPDGRRVMFKSDEKTLNLVDVDTGKPVFPPIVHKGVIHGTGYSPNGTRLITAMLEPFTAQIWDAGTGTPVGGPLAHSSYIDLVQFSPDGSRVLTAGRDGTAHLWDAATANPVAQPLLHPGQVMRAAFSPDGKRIAMAVSGSVRNSLWLWDTATASLTAPPGDYDNFISGLAFSADGRTLLVHSDSTVWLIDPATGRHVFPPRPTLPIEPRLSPDGRRLLTAEDNIVSVWDLPPSDRPLSDLKALAEFYSGRRADPVLGLVELTADELTTRYERLVKLYPEEIGVRALRAGE